jgi:hypothetical protein
MTRAYQIFFSGIIKMIKYLQAVVWSIIACMIEFIIFPIMQWYIIIQLKFNKTNSIISFSNTLQFLPDYYTVGGSTRVTACDVWRLPPPVKL